MAINPEETIPRDCVPILRDVLDGLPTPSRAEGAGSHALDLIQANFDELINAVMDGAEIPWSEACKIRAALLECRDLFYIGSEVAQIDTLIAECIRRIEEVLRGGQILSLVRRPEKFSVEDGREIVFVSRVMREVLDLAVRLADEEGAVLLVGETGVGKEAIARALHNGSRRNQQPFRAINCAALPADLLESELFGHKGGAFTGATRDHKGLFTTVGGGTLFLDEIGEMGGGLQSKLLRALQERKFRRVGDSGEELSFSGRIVSATNIDIRAAVDAHRFRSDLLFRLGQFHIEIPPLRDRREDIDPLIDFFLAKLNGGNAKITHKARRKIREHRLPGNVRELENILRQAFAKATLHGTENVTIDEGHVRFLL